MKIITAEHAGFCGGVRKAVDAALKAAGNGAVYSLGPLAHNESLLRRLHDNGVVTVERLADVPPGAKVLIRTHGVTPDIFAEAAQRGIEIIDATCPYVAKLQKLVATLTAEGKQVIIVGDPAHPEVQGLVGWGNGEPHVISSPEQISQIDSNKPLAVVAQTTQRQSIVNEIGEKLKEQVPAVDIYETICQATVQRQATARELADEVDVMVVVGGSQSSNTRKLAEICRDAGVKTIQITEADELDTSQLQDVGTVGVTAGASTPDWTIKEVIGKMENEKNVESQEEPEVQEEQEEQEEQVAVEEVSLNQEVREFSAGDVVTGTIVQISEDEVLVDIGYKSEGVLPRQEMILKPDEALSEAVQIGQEIEVVVKNVDTQEGRVLLSRKNIERKNKWEELEQAFENGNVLTGRVKEAVQAGLVVDLGGGYEGFMPGSLVDIRFIPDFSEFVNQEITFKVIEIRREKEKLILSRKQVLEEESSAQKEQILKGLKQGEIIRGTVKRLTNFGAFVDVGGIDGLVHISEISWHRIDHPSEVLNVNDEIDVKVIEVIPERERIGLSIRQALPDPWTEITKKFKAGEVVEGKVTRLVDFGVFVELIPGVEGLVHISQLAGYHVKQASEVVQQGETVKVKILDINTEAKRVSLSMRDASPRPKKEATQQQQYQQPADTGTGLTLGDVFGNLFDTSDNDKEE
ncbi:MAG: bifunctional 4-hydroxy-3-methylbut-2-enyl diphosphate reductase/30S ribosomal protein S1 [Clostridiales bacterium]|nr:bifunctional 4-hydroxy-3-methylbut-2-enyl diphosphate reductase/30S ribosomal protein S1 [Clostridiales bacterium]